jgi:uncharacterized protein (TIGR02001 family)
MNYMLMSAALAAMISTPAFGQSTSAGSADAVAATSSIGGSLTVVSDYVVRGIDQTFGKPGVVGTLDYSNKDGWYFGNYDASVNSGAGYPGGNLEMDFYGGRRFGLGEVALDAGAMYYSYPGTDAAMAPIVNDRTGHAKSSGMVHNQEVYLAATWKFLTLKYSRALGTYFSIPDTSGSTYTELAANQDIADGWGISAHVGRMHLKNYDIGGVTGSYTDWRIGVTKMLDSWQLGLTYLESNARGAPGEPYHYGNAATGSTRYRNAARNITLASISKTF